MTDVNELDDEFTDDLLADFIDESEQLLARLNENLHHLDEQIASCAEGEPHKCAPELLDDMFRAAHSIKGLSAMLGLGDINLLTHKIENLFHAARQHQLTIDANVVAVVYTGCDQLVDMIDNLKNSNSDSVNCDDLFVRIEDLLEAAGAGVEAVLDIGEIDAMTATPQASGPSDTTPQTEPDSKTEPDPTPQAEPDPPEIDLLEGLMDEQVPAKYLSIFIDETEMSLDSMADVLVDSDLANSSSASETLLITSHRIKGSAASVGLNRPARLAHFLEDVLQECRETKRILSPEVVDIMLKCTDALRNYVDTLRQGDPCSESFNALAHELLRAFAKSKQPTEQAPEASTQTEKSTPPKTSAPEAEAPAPAPSAKSTQSGPATSEAEPVPNNSQVTVWDEQFRQKMLDLAGPDLQVVHGQVFFDANLPMAGLKASLIYEKLVNTGNVLHCDPEPNGLEDLDTMASFSFALAGDFEIDALRPQLDIAGVARYQLESWQSSKKKANSSSPTSSPNKTSSQPVSASTPQPSTAAAPSQPSPEAKPPASSTGRRTSDSKTASSAATSGRRAGDNSAKPAETLRVDIERLDQLMNLAGQLVISKARFARIAEGQRGAMLNKQTPQLVENASTTLTKIEKLANEHCQQLDNAKDLDSLCSDVRRLQNDLQAVHLDLENQRDLRAWTADLFEAVHELGRVSDGIQKSVMDTRMVPIGPLFTRFKRVIRDITRANSKDIRLEIRGEKTELDKRMIDELGDPLIHMVRNSADHGIESPEDREAVGKSRSGTVTLDAFHRGNSIVIQVTDDGKGLSKENILDKAMQKGIVDQAASERLTDHDIYQLIWEPGFSTAEQVTEISGRGMGMDIVRSKIEDLNGTVDIESTPGQGATFTVQLPLTMAILPSLLSKIDGDVFATPIESVLEIVCIEPCELRTVHGMLTARVRNRTISVVELKDLFQWNRASTNSFTRDPNSTTLVIIGSEGREIGLAVDELLGEEDIVIKSMAENYQNIHGLSGASILGDGSVSLILDPTALIELAARQSNAISTNS